MWLMKSSGLDYRGSAHSPAKKIPFQGTLQVIFLLCTNRFAHISLRIIFATLFGNYSQVTDLPQDYLAGAPGGVDINIEAGPSKLYIYIHATRTNTTILLLRTQETTGPLKPRHAEFLQTLMSDYRGERTAKVGKKNIL